MRGLTALATALLVAAVGWFTWHEHDQKLEAAQALSVRRAARLAEELTQTLALARVAIAQAEARLQRLPAGASLAGMLGEAAAERAQLLATQFDGQAVSINALAEILAAHDIVVTSTASPLPIIAGIM